MILMKMSNHRPPAGQVAVCLDGFSGATKPHFLTQS
jgi:hypothetical protein